MTKPTNKYVFKKKLISYTATKGQQEREEKHKRKSSEKHTRSLQTDRDRTTEKHIKANENSELTVVSRAHLFLCRDQM